MRAWTRRTRRAYNPTTFREADAAVARLMRDLRQYARDRGMGYTNGAWKPAIKPTGRK